MKLHSLRVAASFTAALTTAISPLLVSAQTAYEYKLTKPGLVVTGAPSDQAGLQLSTSAINFGDVATNTTETRQVLVSNPGTGSLSFTAAPAVTGDAAFSAGLTTCGSSLAVGADCLTDATFSPTTVGTYNGVLKFTSMLASSPHEVTLVGAAFNPVSLASTTLPKARLGVPYSYDFKQLLAVSNEASPDKSLATWNGSGTLPTGLSFNTGTGVLSGTPSVLSPGAEYTVTGTYKNNQGQQVYTIKVGEVVLEVVQINTGDDYTCAVTTSGAAKCWGLNSKGQLGDGSTTNRTSPADVVGLSSGVASIATGSFHTCALMLSGAAKCWGYNLLGQLGDGTTTDRWVPANVVELSSGVASVAVGYHHTCALTTSGAAKCWGRNYYGQLGDGTGQDRSVPVGVAGLSSSVASIKTGYAHTCAVTTAGATKCWGYNYYGQLGVGATTDRSTPADVTGLSSGVAGLAIGYAHTCAVTTGGAVKCWGYNSKGQLGDGTATQRTAPVNVVGLSSGVTSIAKGSYHTCALSPSGTAKCWGSNFFGQLGNGTTADSVASPVDVVVLSSGITSIVGGVYHACALTTTGAAKCWGYNAYGQLGDGTTTQRSTPVNVLPQ